MSHLRRKIADVFEDRRFEQTGRAQADGLGDQRQGWQGLEVGVEITVQVLVGIRVKDLRQGGHVGCLSRLLLGRLGLRGDAFGLFGLFNHQLLRVACQRQLLNKTVHTVGLFSFEQVA